MISIKIGMLSKCPDIFSLSTQAKQQKRLQYAVSRSQEGSKPSNATHKAAHRKRSFSDAKKDFKRKVLVTYDIHENKKEAYLIQLMEALVSDPLRMKAIGNHVLPISTPTARIDELVKKLNEKKNKNKKMERKLNKKNKDKEEEKEADDGAVAVKLKDSKNKTVIGSMKLEDIEEVDAEAKHPGSNKNSTSNKGSR